MTEAYAVVERWGETFNEGDADAVARLYAPAATIWGTLGQHLTTSPADIRTYFIEAARAVAQPVGWVERSETHQTRWQK
jgi:hypothetical protein